MIRSGRGWRCRTVFNCTEACSREIRITKAIGEVKKAILKGSARAEPIRHSVVGLSRGPASKALRRSRAPLRGCPDRWPRCPAPLKPLSKRTWTMTSG